MSTARSPIKALEELADLFASSPDRERVLRFRLSNPSERRARDLLEKERSGQLSPPERRELDQFEQAEILMRLVKARLNSQTGQK